MDGSPFESWTSDHKTAKEFAERRTGEILELDLNEIDPGRIAADLRFKEGRQAAADAETDEVIKKILLSNQDSEVILKKED